MGHDAPSEPQLAHVQGLLARGEHAGAVAACRRLLARSPGHPRLCGLLGLGLLQQGALEAAEQALQEALSAAPEEPAFLNALGIVRMRQQRTVEALGLLERCLARSPYDRDALGNLAALYTAANQPARAQPYLQRLVRLMPESADVLTRVSDNSLALGAVADAIHHARKAVRLAPQSAAGRFALADAMEAGGRFQQAKVQYLAILEADPANAAALAQLFSLKETFIPLEYLSGAQLLLRDSRVSTADRIRLHMGLARYLDAGGHFAEAFKHLQAGNALRFRSHPFDGAAFSSAVDRLIATDPGIKDAEAPAESARRPLFILGMPRSGTTLVEQILASHSRVAAGGELPTIINLVTELGGGTVPYPEVVAQLGETERARLAKRYHARLETVSSTAARVTDKMPYNFMHLGLIARLFPDATVIHCRRNALDTCLSCYFTEFNESFEFASDLPTLARYWLDYDRLMRHWHEVLPLRILDLHYETLVDDTERTARALLDFCGLEWEAQCLLFHRNAAEVHTPSRWQVRQPIYRQSVGRWRNYANELGVLRAVLDPNSGGSPNDGARHS